MIKIISDSTCDLSDELIKKYNISILPLYINLENEGYKDGIDITPQEIFKWSDSNNITPKTSAFSISDAIELFEKHSKEGKEIIAFSLSSKMSTSYNVMNLAAKELGKEDSIHIIDSKNLSTAIGLLVLEAATMAKEGIGAKDIVDEIERMKAKVRGNFIVDTLTYLYRGGRCNSLEKLAGGILKLHPKIIVEEGSMIVGKKYRGKMSKAIMDYVKDLEDDLLSAREDRVFITHAACDEKIINEIYQYLEGLDKFKEILITEAGGVISSHCGPGTLGVLYISE